jgi:hypothetical protein
MTTSLFASKNIREKRRQWHDCVVSFFTSNKNKKWKEEDDGIFFFSSKRKKRKNTEKTNIERQKMQRKEGAYLSSFTSTFGMKRSSCLFLSTFLQS